MLRRCLILSAILLLALGLHLALFQSVRLDPQRAISPDSELYLELGQHFRAAYIDASPDYLSDSILRTPGYPLFCAACFAAAYVGILPVIVGQIGVSMACIVLTYLLAKVLFSPRVALWAAFLLALDPLSATYANYVRNETFFTLLLVASTILWFRSLRKPGVGSPWLAGLLLGLSVLTRPVSLYLMVGLVPLGFILKRASLSGRLVHAIVLIIGFAIPVGGWMARNQSLTGGPLISSIEGVDLLYFRAAGAIAEEQGETRPEVAQRLEIAFREKYGDIKNPARLNGLQKAEAFELLQKHPRGAALSMAKGASVVLLGPGQASLFRLLGIAGDDNEQNEQMRTWLSRYQFGYLAVLYGAALIGIIALCKYRAYGPVLALLCVILYFTAACAGPEGYSRYRVPIMPYFAVLAGCGFGLAGSSRDAESARRKISQPATPSRRKPAAPVNQPSRRMPTPKRPAP